MMMMMMMMMMTTHRGDAEGHWNKGHQVHQKPAWPLTNDDDDDDDDDEDDDEDDDDDDIGYFWQSPNTIRFQNI